MGYFLYEIRLHGIMVVIFIILDYYDSLQACLKQGPDH